jgi:GT2 family glycosyltransferase
VDRVNPRNRRDVLPAVSVIIPTFNRRSVVTECLCALVRQDCLPDRFEVIVVDDGSGDGTAQAVAVQASASTPHIVLVRQPNSGANAARNKGISLARGAILVFLNDDSIAAPGLVAEHIRMHTRYPEQNVAILGALYDSPALAPSIFNDLHRDPRFDRLPEGADLDWRSFYTYNVSLKAELLQDDRFNPGLRWHEDVELGQRLARRGLRICFAPMAIAYHQHAMSETGYLATAEREGVALAAWYQSMPELKHDLVDLGLRSSRLGTSAARHILADVLIARWNWQFWIAIARTLTMSQPGFAKFLYRKLYQRRCRQTIESTLAAAPEPRACRG